MVAAPACTTVQQQQQHRRSSARRSSKNSSNKMIYREAVAPGFWIAAEMSCIVASRTSAFQQIEVVDSTYFGTTLITDGKTQSAALDEFVYHESLVHPAMLQALSSTTPSSSLRVFVGGGGELATAREVLRYGSVAHVVMVDVDELVVDMCREHLPAWGGESVLSDPRLELVIGDAYQYLMEKTNEESSSFDVIILDISDPIEAGPGIQLYTKELYAHAKTLLTPNGVFVTQAGTAESIPHASSKDLSCFAPITNTLREVFSTTIPYSTNIPSFGGDWGFVMALKNAAHNSSTTTDNDGSTAAGSSSTTIDRWIDQHVTSGGPLRFYDGDSHLSMLHLVKPLRRAMENDPRIMTRDHPVFMY